MTAHTFRQLTDRQHLDRLLGTILAFSAELEAEGYRNMDIARELHAAALFRANREPSLVAQSFYHHIRDTTTCHLARLSDLYRSVGRRLQQRQHH